MKYSIAFLFVLVVALVLVEAIPSKGSTKASLKKKPCLKECDGVEYKPVCGGDGTGKSDKSFGSECVLNNYNCENNQNLKVVSQGECPGGGSIRLQ
ncbi:turripeptide Pal9.2-like [Diorhabda sublineata]|uniref:turripeptide Pal9.2-like n=1 Tax=Diorhabda sublineata TaxID=1163346 RepID=UPI0024E0780F|nr:turripeptide Pal9.2-like [Diorhabda sublineata]